MAFMECSFFSESLGMCVTANVLLPQSTMGQIGLTGRGSPIDCPVLYLLHGMSDDHSIWERRTRIECYAAQYGIAVVMPNAHRSYYNNTAGGLNYWDYVSKELPAVMSSFFRFSTKPEDTFVAGLSMGGFGSLKLAFNCPEKFAAAGFFSSAIRPAHLLSCIPSREAEFKTIFGDMSKVENSINDIYCLAEKAAAEKTALPALYMACGTEDFLYAENQLFKSHLEKISIPFEYREEPGSHTWDFWDKHILEFLKWIDSKGLLKK